jgi:hypothetical protein
MSRGIAAGTMAGAGEEASSARAEIRAIDMEFSKQWMRTGNDAEAFGGHEHATHS